MGLVFDEATMMDGSIFKFEERLHSHMNKYIDNGAMLVTYFSQDENASTVDRGLQDIDQLFGKNAPLRYIQIQNFPIYGFGQTKPESDDSQQIEDIAVDGTCIVNPSTVVPRPMDFFIIKHLKMTAIFEVTKVDFDSMKTDGFYQITYHLHSTSKETIEKIEGQVTNKAYTDLNAIGSNRNPIIKEDDFVYRGKLEQMVNKMIEGYRALYYNEKHNCFLYRDQESGLDWFDMCANEFIAKHSLMNYQNSAKVIVLNNKIPDIQLTLRYHNSIFSWIEMGAPERLLQKFYFMMDDARPYPSSSFVRWGEPEVQILYPLAVNEVGILNQFHSYFDDAQLAAFLGKEEPINEYEKLIWKFIHRTDLTIHDVSLYTADALINSVRHHDVFFYTPIIVYIIRFILDLN